MNKLYKEMILAVILFLILVVAQTARAQEAGRVGLVKGAVLQELQKYYRVEVGNRVTEYNFRTLVGRIEGIFKRFEAAEQKAIQERTKKNKPEIDGGTHR